MTIQLNGKQHPIKFGMGALYQYERKTGRSAISDFQQVAGGSPSITILALMNWLTGWIMTPSHR